MRFIEEEEDIYKEESFRDMMSDLQRIRNEKGKNKESSIDSTNNSDT